MSFNIFTICLVALNLVFPPTIFAVSEKSGSKVLVVVPVHDGVSDNISNELAESFSKALILHGMQVVSKEKVESVLGYYQREKSTQGGMNEAEEALARGKEHYFNFDYAEAMAQTLKSIKLMEAFPQNISEHGTLLRDAYITAGIIEKSEKGRDESAKEYFRRALEIDPQYEVDEKAYAPSVVSRFAEVRAQVSGQPAGFLSVETDPKVAEVYVNGVLKGVTPIIVSGLPAGKYKLAIKTNKYKNVEKEIVIAGGETARIRETLYWAHGAGSPEPVIHNVLSAPNEAREQIAEGVRITELLRVPKVVMVDADERADGSGEIAVRMIDRKYRAGHNPIVVSYGKKKTALANDLAAATGILAKQADVAILDNPTKNIDPDGIGDPVLLGKRGKKALLAVPAFWGIVGGVLAATAGGAAAAVALSGGDDGGSGNGSVNVQFK